MTDAPIIKLDYLPMAEFMRRYDQDGPFELIDGEVVPKMPSVSLHNKVSKRMLMTLLPFEQQGLGEVFHEATFVLTDNPDWVRGSRVPDVMFVIQATLARFESEVPDWQDKPYILVPEIAIEVVSPTDNYSDINRKVKRYLRDGVQLMWIVDPQLQEAIVYRKGSNQQTTLSGDQVLRAEPVLAELSVKVSAIFA